MDFPSTSPQAFVESLIVLELKNSVASTNCEAPREIHQDALRFEPRLEE